MAEFVLKNAKMYVSKYDLSGNHNQLALSYSADILDKTVFGSSFRRKRAGLMDVSLSAQGYFDASSSKKADYVYWDNLSTGGIPVTISPLGGSTGARAFIFESIQGSYNPMAGGSIGDVLPFDVEIQGSSGRPLVQASVLTAKADKSTTVNSPAINIGVASSSQKLHGTLHVFSVSATGGGSPSIVVDIITSSSSGFGSGSTRLTFTTVTGVTAQFATTAPSTIQPYARAEYTVASSSHTFNICCAAGNR